MRERRPTTLYLDPRSGLVTTEHPRRKGDGEMTTKGSK